MDSRRTQIQHVRHAIAWRVVVEVVAEEVVMDTLKMNSIQLFKLLLSKIQSIPNQN